MSLMARALPALMRLKGANKNYRTREAVRRHVAELSSVPREIHPPRRIRKGLEVVRDDSGGWPVFTIRPSHGRPSQGTVVYLHGGGWIHGPASAHWSLMQKMADEAGTTVVMPAYPLVHEGGTAASVVPRVAALCLQVEGPLVLMGDSAGGSIALSTQLALAGMDNVNRAVLTVLIAPALDLRFGNPEIDVVQPRDPWLVKKGQLELSEAWIGDNGEDPVLNPFLADPKLVGKLLVFSGTRDILNPDVRLFTARMRTAGVDIEYREQFGHLHVYPLLPTPEGARARNSIVDFVRVATTTKG